MRAQSFAVWFAVVLAGCTGAPDGDADSSTPTAGDPPCTGVWEELPPLEPPRTEAAAVAVDGKLWVIGGLFDVPGGGNVGRVDVLDPASGAWSAAPPLPLPLHHIGAVTMGDTIFVTGGFVGAPQFVAQAGMWILVASDPAPVWLPGPPLPGPRGGHIAVTDDTWVYIAGGVTGTAVYAPPGPALLDPTVWRWNARDGLDPWERLADLPDPRDHLAGAYHDGKVYAIGGRDLTLNTNSGRVDVLDVASGAWSQGPDMPTARGGVGAGVVCGSVCVVGGEATGGTYDNTECLDLDESAWRAAPDMLVPRHGVAVNVLGGALYVVGGGPEPAYSYSTTVQRFVPA